MYVCKRAFLSFNINFMYLVISAPLFFFFSDENLLKLLYFDNKIKSAALIRSNIFAIDRPLKPSYLTTTPASPDHQIGILSDRENHV